MKRAATKNSQRWGAGQLALIVSGKGDALVIIEAIDAGRATVRRWIVGARGRALPPRWTKSYDLPVTRLLGRPARRDHRVKAVRLARVAAQLHRATTRRAPGDQDAQNDVLEEIALGFDRDAETAKRGEKHMASICNWGAVERMAGEKDAYVKAAEAVRAKQKWIIEFRNGSYFTSLDADHGGAKKDAARFDSKELADAFISAHFGIAFAGGMAVLDRPIERGDP